MKLLFSKLSHLMTGPLDWGHGQLVGFQCQILHGWTNASNEPVSADPASLLWTDGLEHIVAGQYKICIEQEGMFCKLLEWWHDQWQAWWKCAGCIFCELVEILHGGDCIFLSIDGTGRTTLVVSRTPYFSWSWHGATPIALEYADVGCGALLPETTTWVVFWG